MLCAEISLQLLLQVLTISANDNHHGTSLTDIVKDKKIKILAINNLDGDEDTLEIVLKEYDNTDTNNKIRQGNMNVLKTVGLTNNTDINRNTDRVNQFSAEPNQFNTDANQSNINKKISQMHVTSQNPVVENKDANKTIGYQLELGNQNKVNNITYKSIVSKKALELDNIGSQGRVSNHPNQTMIKSTNSKDDAPQIMKPESKKIKLRNTVASSKVKNISLKNQHSNKSKLNSIKKCYVLTTELIPVTDLDKIMNDFKALGQYINAVFKKNIVGFTFCTNNIQVLEEIRRKHNLINIEEDKIYRISSVENDISFLYNIHFSGPGINDFNSDFYAHEAKEKDTRSQSPVPFHFYRIYNLGRMIFNNYLLDNLLFRIIGLNRLIKYFYSYKYVYSGKGVKVSIIDTKKCNSHRLVNSSLIVGLGNSLGKDAMLDIIECFECDGTIKLSNLLENLEDMEMPNVLVLPFSGPFSESLNLAIKRLSQRTITIAAGGNNSENSCNYSPTGNHIIKIGSVNKHGAISNFSNRGGCINLYSLGENIMNSKGTSYSASFVAGGVTAYLELHPGASKDDVLEFLLKSSLKNDHKYSVFTIVELHKTLSSSRTIYTGKQILYTNILIISIFLCIAYFLYKMYLHRRTNINDNVFSTRSLR